MSRVISYSDQESSVKLQMSGQEQRAASQSTGDETQTGVTGLDQEELLLQYGNLQGIELLHEMITSVFPGRIALVSSFGAHSAVLLDMVSRVDRQTDILFLDTGKLFPETLSYKDSLVQRLGLENVHKLKPEPADVEESDPSGDLWSSSVDRCCYIRKVRPLQGSLASFDCWITGRKRYQGGLRSQLNTIEFVNGSVKINPLALWSQQMVVDYFKRHDLPYHPLYEHGYLSLGCMPCTKPVPENGSERGGRWTHSAKSECGIHGRQLRKSDY